jgi:hypothetical protein
MSLLELCVKYWVKQLHKNPSLKIEIPYDIMQKIDDAYAEFIIKWENNLERFLQIERRWWAQLLKVSPYPLTLLFLHENVGNDREMLLYNLDYNIIQCKRGGIVPIQKDLAYMFDHVHLDTGTIKIDEEEADTHAMIHCVRGHVHVYGFYTLKMDIEGEIKAANMYGTLSPLPYLKKINNCQYLEWKCQQSVLYHEVFNVTELLQLRIPWL